MIQMIIECKCCGREIKKRVTKGLCDTCYLRFLRTGSLEQQPRGRKKGGKNSTHKNAKCTIEGCINKHTAKGLCMKHYKEQRRKEWMDK